MRYIQSVVAQEWPSMVTRNDHPATTRALLELRTWVLSPDIPYATPVSERFFHETLLELTEARQQRISITRQAIPEILSPASAPRVQDITIDAHFRFLSLRGVRRVALNAPPVITARRA